MNQEGPTNERRSWPGWMEEGEVFLSRDIGEERKGAVEACRSLTPRDLYHAPLIRILLILFLL